MVAGIAGLAVPPAGSAYAADLDKGPVYKASAPLASIFTWAGCYVGGNVGWIKNKSTLHVEPAGQYLLLPADFPPALLAFVTQDYSATASVATAGGQIGCNLQSANLVFGAEGDFNWAGIRDSVNASYPRTPLFSGRDFLPRNLTITDRHDWFSTIRGRIGYSFGPMMIFATGGVAFGLVNSSFFQIFSNGITDQGSAEVIRAGWTAGGGLEYALWSNWSAKVEYLYIDLGSFSYVSPASDDPRFLWRTTVRTRDHVARVGLNYHFNWGMAPTSASARY